MKKEKPTVSGVFAPPPKPDIWGFVLLAIVISGPVAFVWAGVEYLIRWGV